MNKIINISIIAHVDAGKTTLTEQLLYKCGAIRETGRVDKGTTVSDFLPLEIERKISIKSSYTSMFFEDAEINIIDTPGHIDFSEELERSLSITDAVVLVVSSVDGIQPYTKLIWKILYKLKIPTIIFLNKTDRIGSNSENVINQISELLDVPKYSLLDITDIDSESTRDVKIKISKNIEKLELESIINYDDSIAEDYILGNDISKESIKNAAISMIYDFKLFPVIKGSALFSEGIEELLYAVSRYIKVNNVENDLSGLVYKIDYDPKDGKIAYIRLFSGTINVRDQITINGKQSEEKITQIRKYNGKKYQNCLSLTSGEIGAVCGLKSINISDYIGYKNEKYKSITISKPYTFEKVIPLDDSSFDNLYDALKKLETENPYLNVKWIKESDELNISLSGSLHRDFIINELKRRFNINASFSKPTIIYKETPSISAEGADYYTMPKPCWAIVKFLFEPLETGRGVVYESVNIPSNTCNYSYQDQIKKSFFANLKQGLFGWEITDFKATLIYAEHHTIHTHPLDFYVATPMAIMNTLKNCGSTILEPIIQFDISAPSDYYGPVISETLLRNGSFDGLTTNKGLFFVSCFLPAEKAISFPERLISITGGKAEYFSRFSHYKKCEKNPIPINARIGPNPLDRAKWILFARGAMSDISYSLL